MGLNAKQKEAVEYLDGPLLVVAGPGTGKTQLLGSKVAYILKNTDTAPENILCLTFTETGASNMRERLKRLAGTDGMKVNVGTYHAFGQEILRQYKDYSETFNRQLDGAIEGVAQFKIIRDLMEKLPATDLLRGDKVRDVLKIITEAKGARLSAADLAAIAEQNIEDSKVLSESISPLLSRVVPRNYLASLAKAYQPIFEVLRPFTEAVPMIKVGYSGADGPKIARTVYEIAAELSSALESAAETRKITPLTSWKDKYFEKDGKGNYRLKDRVKNLKLRSIAQVMAAYDTYLRENGLYDFSDMIEEAIRALETDEGFKLTLEERYQVILLDEFQDTNPAQLAIVKHLTDYEKPLIMAVGDDDQGIYAFQGALSSNLRDFQEYYGAKVIRLEENYRSTQEILDFSRKIMEQAPDRFLEKSLTAHKETPTSSQIERREFLSSDGECAYIARRIHELVSAGVPQHEIAVLSYKSKYFEPLLPFLKEYPEIKIAYEKQDNVLENPAIFELLQVSRFVYELANEKRVDISLVEILGYEFWGLNTIEVIRAVESAKREHRNVFEQVEQIENVALREVLGFLASLAAKSFTEPLEVFLDYLMGVRELDGYRSPFMGYYTSSSEAADAAVFRLYENLATLRAALSRYFREGGAKLADLISMLDDYAAAGETISLTSPYREADSAVQIMTAHKAKGLEFEYVFIITADTNAWGKGGGNHDTTSLPKNVTFIHHTGMTDGERIRVLYVALTRAKSHLIITNARHDFSGKARGRLEYLQEYEEEGVVHSPLIPSGVVSIEAAPEDIAVRAASVRNWFSRYVEPQPELRSYFLERAKNLRFSATALTSFIDVVYGGPQEFLKTYLMPSTPEPETEALAYGTLIHKTFEYVTGTMATDEGAVDYFLSELSKHDLPSDVSRHLREKGPVSLAAALSEFRPIIERGKAEVDFSTDRLVVDGVRVTGKIDHIVIDEDSKTIELYDFKTAGYRKNKWENDPALYKYALQLMFYKMLLNYSPRFSKYAVTRGHILFVAPDKDGQVYDKVYEFSPEAEGGFRRLLSAVASAVSSLEFMDDPEVFIAPDGGKGIKDIREFSEMVIDKFAKV